MSRQQRDTVDQLLRAAPLDFGGDLAEQRRLLEQIMTAQPLAEDVVTSTRTTGGVPVLDVTVSGIEPRGVLVYLHGGAYTMGSAAAVVGLASELARRAGVHVISVDYRLAPEYPYPAALHDALAVYRAVLGSGADPCRVVVAGESAGGGLALATLVGLAAHHLPQPSSAVVLSPWADLTLSGESVRAKANADPIVTADGLRRRAHDYAAGLDPADPRLSPVFADLRGLAPLLIQAGGNEILLDDATRLAARAARAGVEVTLEVTPGVPHVFQSFSGALEEADAALDRAGAFVRAHLPADPELRAHASSDRLTAGR